MTAIKHLNIEVTRRCNQRCFYCFNDSAPDQRDTPLPVPEWCRILRVLETHGLRSIHVTGGEPFLWAGTIPLLREAQELGLSTSILSNGYRVPQLLAYWPAVFRRLTVAQISLDAVDSETHDRRRGVVTAHRWAMDAIVVMRGINIPVEVSCVVDDSNSAEIPRLATFCRTWGCRLLLRPLIRCGRAVTGDPRCSDGVRRAIAELSSKLPDLFVADRFFYLPDEDHVQAHLYGFHTADPLGTLRAQARVGCIAVGCLRDVA